jgi:hypothetical protein
MDNEKDWGALARLLLQAAGDRVADLGRPIWVRVLDPPAANQGDGFSLAFCDDADALMGWVATADCQAVGMIGTGRLRPLPGSPPGLDWTALDRLRMACLLARDGAMAWEMVQPDGTPPDDRLPRLPPCEGRLLDCLRRCFGLPTAPPPASPARLQIIVWLVAILEHTEGARRPLGWSEVARLHPVAHVLASELGSRPRDLIPDLMRVAGSAWSWGNIRGQAQQEGFLEDIIDPCLAGWMDDGMFARWVLSELPAADELYAAVRPGLTPSASRRLAHAVHAAVAAAPARAPT